MKTTVTETFIKEQYTIKRESNLIQTFYCNNFRNGKNS